MTYPTPTCDWIPGVNTKTDPNGRVISWTGAGATPRTMSQATPGYRPLLDESGPIPCIVFDKEGGSGKYDPATSLYTTPRYLDFESTFNLDPPCTYVIVAEMEACTTADTATSAVADHDNYLFRPQSGAACLLQVLNGTPATSAPWPKSSIRTHTGSGFVDTGIIAVHGRSMYAFASTAGGFNFRHNGYTYDGTAAGAFGTSGSTNQGRLGTTSAAAGITRCWPGAVYRVMIWEGVQLTTTELQEVYTDLIAQGYIGVPQRRLTLVGSSTVYGRMATAMKGLTRRLCEAGLDGDTEIRNYGTPSQTFEDIGGALTSSGLGDAGEVGRLADITALSPTLPHDVFIFAASNDLFVQSDSAATAYNSLKTCCAALKAAGVRYIAVATVFARSGTSGQQTARLAYNALVRAGVGVDGFDFVCDWAGDAFLGDAGFASDPEKSLDGTHMGDLAWQRAGDLAIDTCTRMWKPSSSRNRISDPRGIEPTTLKATHLDTHTNEWVQFFPVNNQLYSSEPAFYFTRVKGTYQVRIKYASGTLVGEFTFDGTTLSLNYSGGFLNVTSSKEKYVNIRVDELGALGFNNRFANLSSVEIMRVG